MAKLFAPLGRFSKLSDIGADLDAVQDRGPETPESEVGLKPGSVDALWDVMRGMYATGVQPGLQLSVSHQGQVVMDRAIGHARGNAPGDSIPKQPMHCNTPVNLFSAAKAVSAMLVHKLAELGYFNLDDAVASYLRGFERHGKGGITIRDVLVHRGALTKLPESSGGMADLDIMNDSAAMREMVLNLKPQGRIRGPAGYHAITGGFVMAELMQEVTGETARNLLAQYIKEPLGLRWLDFGATPETIDKVALNASTGWVPGPIAWHLSRVVGAPFDEAIEVSNDPRFLTAVIPSANLLSTARDMANFYQCLLNDGEWQGQQVFRPETVRQAIAPDSKSNLPVIDRVIGIPIRYSPGFMLGHNRIGLYGWSRVNTFGHFGFTSTLTWARPDTGTAVSLLTNGKPILGPHIAEMIAMFRGFNALCENRIV